jgi:uncharacterized protein (TIGR03382 family)
MRTPILRTAPLAGLLSTLGLLVAAASVVPARAEACGGFFCQNVPIDQAGENIMFTVEGDQVEAFVQIQYQGDAENFAWIVPTPTLPTVGVSTDALFPYLTQNFTRYHRLEERIVGDCQYSCPSDWWNGGDNVDAVSDTGSSDAGDGGGVTVVLQAQTGPYDYAILQATDVEQLFDWLRANDYVIPDTAIQFVEPYALMGDTVHFVAFKLQKNRSAGDIQPVRLRYTADQPMIPIQLTAIAAQPDMPLYVTILADKRAVPENYLHAVLNPLAFGYVNASEPIDLISRAVDAAGGRAFVTSFAGSTSSRFAFYSEGQFYTEGLAGITDPIEFVQSLLNRGFNGTTELLSLLQTYLPMPASLAEQGYTPQQFYNELTQTWWCGPACEAVQGTTIDAPAFVAAIEEQIVEPRREAEEVLSRFSYATRMVTTLDPAEMTVDPVFALNATLPDVDDSVVGTATIYCGAGGAYGTAPTVLELRDGREIAYRQSQFNDMRRAFDAFPLERAEQLAASGDPVVVTSNRAAIDAAIGAWNESHSGLSPEPLDCPDSDDTGLWEPDDDAGAISDTGVADAGSNDGAGTDGVPTVDCDGTDCEVTNKPPTRGADEDESLFGCSSAPAGGSLAWLALAALAARRRRR